MLPTAKTTAQCPNDNQLCLAAPQDLTPPGVGMTAFNAQVWGGEYVTVNVSSGSNYTIHTCTSNSYDTHLTLIQASNGNAVTFNDNGCGMFSTITWTATFTGVLHVLLDQSPGCQSNAVNTRIEVTLNSAGCVPGSFSSHPQGATLCPSIGGSLGAAATGSPDSLRWFRSSNGGSTWVLLGNTPPFSGSTTGSLGIGAGAAAFDGQHFRMEAYYCSPVQSIASNSAQIFISDTTAPIALCQNVNLNPNASGIAVLSPASMDNGSSDACGIDTMILSQSVFTCADTGANPVTLTVLDAEGNAGTCTANAIYPSLPYPTPELGPNVAQCSEDTLTLFPGAGLSSYLWSTGDTTGSIMVTTAGTYSVTVSNSFGCLSSDSIIVAVHPVSTAFLNTVGPTTMCLGDSVKIQTPSGFTNFLWSTGDTLPFIIVRDTGGTYTVTAHDLNGCSAMDSVSITFFNIAVPNPVITPGPIVMLCQGSTVSLDAGGGYAGYIWSTGHTTQVVTVSNPVSYQVTVINGFGCTKASDPVTVQSLPVPTPTIFYLNDTLFVSGGYVTYQWHANAAPIPGAALPYYIPPGAGNFSVAITDSNGCAATSPVLFVDPLAVAAPWWVEYGLSLYPNPSQGHVYLSTEKALRGPLSLRLRDVRGRILMENECRGLQGSLRLDLPALSSGIYLLELQSADGQRACLRFVAEE